MKKVLVLTYYWPPSGGPGVQRILKFCNQLPEFGWKPIVVTPANGTFPVRDESLVKEVSADVEVHKTKTLEVFALYNLLKSGKAKKESPVGMSGVIDNPSPFQKLSNYVRANYFIPDARVGWNRYALKAARDIVKSQDIEAIITTGPPHSTHLMGVKLQKEFDLPWIADLRDPWVNIMYNKFLLRTEKSRQKDQEYENLVASSADMLSVVSSGLEEEFSDRANACKLIYNGYDEKDFEHVEPKKLDENYFHLAYIGSFKPNQNCTALWQALSELIRENSDVASSLRITFVGKTGEELHGAIKKYQLEKNTLPVGYVSHKEAISYMAGVQSLLFIVPQVEGNEKILTGKLFEYLAVQNQMLSIGPVHGEASKLVERYEHDAMVDYADKEAIKATLMTQFGRWKKQGAGAINQGTSPKEFTRRSQTKVLAEVLDSLTLA